MKSFPHYIRFFMRAQLKSKNLIRSERVHSRGIISVSLFITLFWGFIPKCPLAGFQKLGGVLQSMLFKLYDELLAVDVSNFHKKEQVFIKRLRKNRQSIFSQFRNAEGKGAERFARLRSIIDTTIKNGQNVFFALNCLAFHLI